MWFSSVLQHAVPAGGNFLLGILLQNHYKVKKMFEKIPPHVGQAARTCGRRPGWHIIRAKEA